jgi:hypothetical protein
MGVVEVAARYRYHEPIKNWVASGRIESCLLPRCRTVTPLTSPAPLYERTVPRRSTIEPMPCPDSAVTVDSLVARRLREIAAQASAHQRVCKRHCVCARG